MRRSDAELLAYKDYPEDVLTPDHFFLTNDDEERRSQLLAEQKQTEAEQDSLAQKIAEHIDFSGVETPQVSSHAAAALKPIPVGLRVLSLILSALRTLGILLLCIAGSAILSVCFTALVNNYTVPEAAQFLLNTIASAFRALSV